MRHRVVEFMEKVFHLSADDVVLCSLLSDIIAALGCRVIELRMLVEWLLLLACFLVVGASLLNLKCFFSWTSVELRREKDENV